MEFVLVSAVLCLIVLSVIQLGLVLHVRNTLVDCASEGARHAALADRSPADGAAHTRALIRRAISPAYAGEVTAGEVTLDGVPMVQVRVEAPAPTIGLLGVGRSLTVYGHGVRDV